MPDSTFPYDDLVGRMLLAADENPAPDNNPETIIRLAWKRLSPEGRAGLWREFMGKALDDDELHLIHKP